MNIVVWQREASLGEALSMLCHGGRERGPKARAPYFFPESASQRARTSATSARLGTSSSDAATSRSAGVSGRTTSECVFVPRSCFRWVQYAVASRVALHAESGLRSLDLFSERRSSCRWSTTSSSSCSACAASATGPRRRTSSQPAPRRRHPCRVFRCRSSWTCDSRVLVLTRWRGPAPL